jgi:drug/metabolite transporter (DMT)-like permease
MVGELCAVGCALAWSTAVILFKRAEHVGAAQTNLFKNTVALVCLGATLLAMGTAWPVGRSGGDWLRVCVSGLIGIAIADTLFLATLRRLGAGLTAIVECVYAPTVVLLSVLFLSERPGLGFAAGGVLVILGVFLATRGERGSAKDVGGGLALGVASIVLMGVGIVLVKPVLEVSSLVEITFVRVAVGVAVQALWSLLWHRAVFAVFVPQPAWRTLLPGAILGSYIAMLMWLGGFKYTDASVAAVLNQLGAVFTLLLGWRVLGEPLHRLRLAGAALAVSGAVLVLGTRPPARSQGEPRLRVSVQDGQHDRRAQAGAQAHQRCAGGLHCGDLAGVGRQDDRHLPCGAMLFHVGQADAGGCESAGDLGEHAGRLAHLQAHVVAHGQRRDYGEARRAVGAI